MYGFLSVLVTLWAAAEAQSNRFNTFITEEVSTFTDPVAKTVAGVASTQCTNLKKIVGVDYNDYENDEPDLSHLTLNCYNKDTHIAYNLSAAVDLIPNAPWFNPNSGLIIYAHGFTDDPSKASYTNISSAFLSKGDRNIVALDASSLIRWFYLRSSTMVRFIGAALGKMLAAMVYRGLPPSSIHLIGHSLGSHISSFAGKTFQNLTGHRVGRITGLDPAGPCFSDVEPSLRLQASDAEFVDVIHTDAGVYGINEIVGHVDFYPNSGSDQPDCLLQTCSHSFAWSVYTETVVNPEAFPAVKCDSWEQFKKGNCDNKDVSLMGYGCDPKTRGLYFLQTNGNLPYGRGASGIKYVSTDGIVKNVTSAIFGVFG